jgi:hypothetical protein
MLLAFFVIVAVMIWLTFVVMVLHGPIEIERSSSARGAVRGAPSTPPSPSDTRPAPTHHGALRAAPGYRITVYFRACRRAPKGAACSRW